MNQRQSKSASLYSLAIFLITLSLSGCAHLKSREASTSSSVSPSSPPKTLNEVLVRDISQRGAPSEPSRVSDFGDLTVLGVKLENTQFDIPITVNSRVEYWINYFCGRGRPHFEKYLERSEYFIPYIAPLLKQNGLPEDLVYLAMIESGFSTHARSHAKAVGPWQFISATGKRYGLMVNWWVDERRDVRKATLAAVEYLRDLYSIFRGWELAAAAYNAGEAKVARAVRRFGTTDFWAISKHRFLRPETRDYVPKIIAAAIVAKNRKQFGFPTYEKKPGADEAVAGDGAVVKVVKSDKPEAEAEASADRTEFEEFPGETADLGDDDAKNPGITPATFTSPVISSLPEGQLASGDTPLPMAKPVPTPHITKSGAVGGEELAEFEVQSPADLLKVARAAGLSYHTVKALNPELQRWCTPPTVGSYRIRLPASTKEKFLVTYNHVAFPRKVQFMTYRVHRGETLTRIARQFGIKVDPISDLNGVSARMPLRNGIRVLLPMPNDRSRSLASLEVKDPPEKKRARRSRRGGKYFKSAHKT